MQLQIYDSMAPIVFCITIGKVILLLHYLESFAEYFELLLLDSISLVASSKVGPLTYKLVIKVLLLDSHSFWLRLAIGTSFSRLMASTGSKLLVRTINYLLWIFSIFLCVSTLWRFNGKILVIKMVMLFFIYAIIIIHGNWWQGPFW